MSNHYILYEEIEYPWIYALLASLEVLIKNKDKIPIFAFEAH